MVVEILRMLLLTIGPSFFLLASVSLVMQNLVSSSDLSRRTHPYSLYAVSNIGSIAALAAYPLVIERWFDIQTQLVLWRNGYTILVLLLSAILFVPVQTKYERRKSTLNPDRGAHITTKIRVLWLVFSAAASMFLLAVTNVLTIDIAGTYFRFIDSCRAELSMIFGDARLNLQRLKPEPYDLIVIDAFSSDAIPVHLLTVEAIHAYNNVLSQEGLLLFHISNKHLDLLPVLQANAQRLALPLFSKSNLGNVHPDAKECQWTVLGRPVEASHERLVLNGWAREDTRTPAVEPWTDHHSSILGALK